MRSRAWRFLVLVIMLASGVGAAWSSWNTSRQIAQLDRSQRDLTDRVDHLLATLDTVTTAQQGYVTPSPGQDPARVIELIGQMRTDADGLRSHVRSIESGRTLQAVAATVATLHDVETRAQEHIRAGQDFMAADLIFSDGRAADDAIASGLRNDPHRRDRRIYDCSRGRARPVLDDRRRGCVGLVDWRDSPRARARTRAP